MLQFISIVTEDFWPGFAALIQSLAENAEFPLETDVRWLLICDKRGAPRRWLEGRSEQITLCDISELQRVEVLAAQNQGKRMENALQKLGIFALPESMGRCIYLDSDLVCLHSVKELATMNAISAAYDHLQFCGELSPLASGQPVEFNTGVLVFEPSRSVFNELTRIYRERHAERSHKGDQDVFYFWAQNQHIKPLGSEWNFSKRHQDRIGRKGVKARLDQIKFLHFVGAKPWTPNSHINTFRECHYEWLENIWWDYFERSGFAKHMDNPPNRSIAFRRRWVLPWSKPVILHEHSIRALRLLRRITGF